MLSFRTFFDDCLNFNKSRQSILSYCSEKNSFYELIVYTGIFSMNSIFLRVPIWEPSIFRWSPCESIVFFIFKRGVIWESCISHQSSGSFWGSCHCVPRKDIRSWNCHSLEKGYLLISYALHSHV